MRSSLMRLRAWNSSPSYPSRQTGPHDPPGRPEWVQWSWDDPRPLLARQPNGGLTLGDISLTLHPQLDGLPARENLVSPAISASR
jgi:hypothetical protein